MNNRIEYQNIGKQNGINVTFGTALEEKLPSVILIRCKGRIKPIIKKTTYEKDINELKDDILNIIQLKIKNSNLFSNEYLANTDISSRSIKYDKYSFIKYDVYVKPYELKDMQSQSHCISELTKSINLSILERLGTNFQIKMD